MSESQTIEILIDLALNGPDENVRAKAVGVLHERGDQTVLNRALALCDSSSAQDRVLGAWILGQLGIPERSFPEECFDALAGMLESEHDPDVLNSITTAMGHLNDQRAIPLLVQFKDHPHPDVRFGVVQGLTGHEHPSAIQCLAALSRDTDGEVRDWATFALGSMIEADSVEIRDALFARLDDQEGNTSGEAMVGLARRKDARVVEPLLAAIEGGDVGTLLLEAASEIADPRLLPALTKLRVPENVDEKDLQLLKLAIENCYPHES